MKFFKKSIALLAVSMGLVMGANAQQHTKQVKIGYTNVDYILSQLPESKQVEAELKTYKTQLDNQLQQKYKDLQDKYASYQKGEALMSEPVKADKQKELQYMQTSIQEFEQSAETSLQKKQQTLLQPVLDKIEKAIKTVADENNVTYVFNSDAGFGTTPVLLHAPESDNISDLVLKKLGVTPPKKEDTKPATTTPASK